MSASNTFESQQQRNYLIHLLSKPSSLYEPAAAAGLSPAAFRLVCWKVQQDLQPIWSALHTPHRNMKPCLQKLAALQGIPPPAAPPQTASQPADSVEAQVT